MLFVSYVRNKFIEPVLVRLLLLIFLKGYFETSLPAHGKSNF